MSDLTLLAVFLGVFVVATILGEIENRSERVRLTELERSRVGETVIDGVFDATPHGWTPPTKSDDDKPIRVRR